MRLMTHTLLAASAAGRKMLLRWKRALTVSIIVAVGPHPLFGQTSGCWSHWEVLGGPYANLQRSIDLASDSVETFSFARRSGWSMLKACADSSRDASGPRVVVLPAASLMEYNSAYPRVGQDGLRWGGRGISASAMAGAAVRWKWFSAMLAPIAAFQQNADFDIQPVVTEGRSPYANFYYRIDLPQRFGDQSFWNYDLGESFARIDAFGVAAGISNETMRWGPAQLNPLLMSGSAPGFPHGFVRTSNPLDVGIGKLEVEMMWGRLAESEYFDLSAANDSRLFGGVVVAFSPKGSGITIGLARAYVRYVPADFGFLDQILAPYRQITVNQGDNELISASLDWIVPGTGFEVYGEFARDDAWEGGRDLALEPDHSRAYTIGVQRVFGEETARNRIRVMGEATNIGRDPTWQSGRGKPNFYANGQISQGYTHRGQLLGAPIGPGSDAQFVGVDVLRAKQMLGFYAARTRFNNDIYYDRYAERYTYAGHDVELTLGLRGGGVYRHVQLVGELARSSRRNRAFLGLQDQTGLTKESNITFNLGAAWTPPR
jgi:hypothetical protein